MPTSGAFGHVAGEHVRTRLLEGQHDRREVLRVVGVTLDRHRFHAQRLQRFDQCVLAARTERVGRVDDRDLLALQHLHRILGHDLGREQIIRADAEDPRIVHARETGIAAADEGRDLCCGDGGRSGLNLVLRSGPITAAILPWPTSLEYANTGARIGARVVFDDQLN
jgi:hypothetical protein